MWSYASYLTSPTIRLSSPESDTQFFVHRAILQRQTGLLAQVKSRENHLALPAPAKDKTLQLFLEYLYTGDYQLPVRQPKQTRKVSFGGERPPSPALTEDEDEEEVHETDAKFGASPLLNAARLGAIGVWGKGPAHHSDYTSIHTAEGYLEPNDRGKRVPSDSIYVSEDNQTQRIEIHTPPASPKAKSILPPPQQHGLRDLVLLTHVEVYRFAKAFELSNLAHLAIKKLSAELHRREGLTISAQVVELIKEAFTRKGEDEELKEFVTGYAAWHIDELRTIPLFVAFIAAGGEFVVRLVGKVSGRKNGHPWVY